MRRPQPARGRAAALTVAGWLLLTGSACADDAADRALAGLLPATASVARAAPVTADEWAHRLRPAQRMAPPALRPVDRALLQAARDGRWPEVQALLSTGRDGVPAHADAVDEAGGSALVLAAAAGADGAVSLLLRRGANAQRTGEDGFTALGAAAFRGRLPTLRLLLRAGTDPLRWGATGQGPLHLAALAGQTDALRVLLDAGVPVDSLNSQRETALDVAAAAGQDAAMDLLIRGGADLTGAGRR